MCVKILTLLKFVFIVFYFTKTIPILLTKSLQKRTLYSTIWYPRVPIVAAVFSSCSSGWWCTITGLENEESVFIEDIGTLHRHPTSLLLSRFFGESFKCQSPLEL